MATVLIILQSILVSVFALVGFQKVLGTQEQIRAFNHLNLPQWLRVLTGWMQLLGVIGLIIGYMIPEFIFISGIWFGIIMVAAVIFHLRVNDPITKAVPALMFASMAIIMIVIG
ncbi:DoxX family protein [Pseudalkalibacillus sp. R45]|uniref:DoxX family protein n=1 Tax=Pseudalkalibacillus sp. R45 TaxID=3457433 RepID=UPI003FCC5157